MGNVARMIQSPAEYTEASLIRQYFLCLFTQTEMFEKKEIVSRV